jgi:hypothetical protein
LLFLLVISILHSQVVKLKIRERGFLGIKSERYVLIKFTVEDGRAKFTDEDVERGVYYYFLCIPEGEWEFNEDLAGEFASKILIQQDNAIHYAEIYDLLNINGKGVAIIGFKKTFDIEKPFKINYPISDKLVSSAEMRVPEKLWS